MWNNRQQLFKKLGTPNGLKMFRLRSVGSKIFLLFFVSILSFVLVLGTISYQISTTSVKNKSAKGIDQTILQATQKLDLLFNLYEGFSNKLVSEADIRTNLDLFFSDRSITERTLAESKALNLIRNSRFSTPGIESTALIAVESHQVLLDSNNPAQKLDPAAAWFDQIVKADGKLVWLDSSVKGFTTTVSKPVFALGRLQKNYYAGSSKPVVCLIEINVDALTEQLKTVDIGKTGQVRVVGKDRHIQQSPNLAELNKEIGLEDLSNNKVVYQGGPEGDQVVSAAYTSAKSGWSVVGYTKVSELIEDTRTIFWVTVTMALCAIVFAVVIGWFAVRMFGKPLVELRNIMKVAESGNLQARTNFRRKDEIAELGESFNGMMLKFTSLIVKTNESSQRVLNMAQELLNASRNTAQSAGEIESVMKETAVGASELAIVVDKSNQLTLEMHDNLVSVIDASGQMKEISGDVGHSSEQGVAFLKEVLLKTNSANTLTEELFEKVNGLQSGAQSIQKVLDLLKDIAQRTNILSLNASIEAARAGAAGKGFMVISNEIRKLADQSKQSINVVNTITGQIQQGVEDAVAALNKAYPVYKEQIGIVEQTDSLFNKVSDYMGDYRNQLQMVTDSIVVLQRTQQDLVDGMNLVSATSQQSAASTEEVAALSSVQLKTSGTLVSLSEDMEKLSLELESSLSLFTI